MDPYRSWFSIHSLFKFRAAHLHGLACGTLIFLSRRYDCRYCSQHYILYDHLTTLPIEKGQVLKEKRVARPPVPRCLAPSTHFPTHLLINFPPPLSRQNPEQVILFAAGNDGDIIPADQCSIMTPATGKNVIAVGSSQSGPLRFSFGATIDAISDFSGRGPLTDGRIKPDVSIDYVGDYIFGRYERGHVEFASTQTKCCSRVTDIIFPVVLVFKKVSNTVRRGCSVVLLSNASVGEGTRRSKAVRVGLSRYMIMHLFFRV